MGVDEFTRRGFKDESVTWVFYSNKECTKQNYLHLLDIKKTIVKVLARDVRHADKLKESELPMLLKKRYVCEDSRVMLLFNVCRKIGLYDGSWETLRDYLYNKEDVSFQPPKLPRYVWVEFDSGTYRGPYFFTDDDS